MSAAPGLAASPETDGTTATTDAALVTTATYLSQSIQFVAGLIHKGLLGPAGAGYWALMGSFWTYFGAFTLGASAGAARQIPIQRGRGDYRAAANAAGSGATFSILAVGAGGMVVAAVALIAGGSWAPELRYGLVIVGLTAPLRMLSDSHEVVLGATRRFRAVAGGLILKSVVAITVQVGAVVAFGFWGMFVGTVITAIALLTMWSRMGLTGIRRPAFALGIDRKALRELIAYGAPILVAGQLFLVFMSIDNLLVAGILDVESLGYYALAVSVTTYILHLPRSIGSVLAPRMAETFGRTDDELSLRTYAEDVQRLLGHVLVPLFLAAAFFGVPVLIRHALPEFTPAIPVVRIMAAGSFFIALNNMPVKTMITTGRRAALIGAIVPCLAINIAGNYVAMAVLDTGIKGAAVATSFSYLVIFLVTGWLALSRLIGRSHTAGHLGELVAVATYTIAVVWGLEALIGESGGLVPDTLLAIAKAGLAVVALSPWLLRSQRMDRGPQRVLELAGSSFATARRALRGTEV